jgi:predicted homoserine dehydrogenase-like protein
LLDGEGGYTVWGKLLPASTSLALGGLPLGLAHNVKLTRAVLQGESLLRSDVAIDDTLPAYKTRREMETLFATRASPENAPRHHDPVRGDRLSAESIYSR